MYYLFLLLFNLDLYNFSEWSAANSIDSLPNTYDRHTNLGK